jgi:alkanesulfonate monooxygenase SsuD/methylene tetrahydromethanopterin reductase-like flavin-dependent oxidoreductase (luciferase family)
VTRFAAALPQFGGGDEVASAARQIEELGFDGAWTLDSGVEPPLAHTPVLDGLHALSFAAAHTARVKLGIAVIVLPRRNPVLLAKELASIDRLSGGRLIVGVGLGRKPDELTARLGLPADDHVRRLREGVLTMRALWTDTFEDAKLEPKPVQRPGPPIWFGARARPALRRAARIGDGWIGAGSSSSQDFAEQSKVLDEELAEAGRRISKAKRVYIAVEDDAAQAFQRLSAVLDRMYASPGMTERVAVCGPAEHCAEALRALVAAGAEELLLHPLYDHARQLDALAGVASLTRG